jgi:hypothetical protein
MEMEMEVEKDLSRIQEAGRETIGHSRTVRWYSQIEGC